MLGVVRVSDWSACSAVGTLWWYVVRTYYRKQQVADADPVQIQAQIQAQIQIQIQIQCQYQCQYTNPCQNKTHAGLRMDDGCTPDTFTASVCPALHVDVVGRDALSPQRCQVKNTHSRYHAKWTDCCRMQPH